MPQDYQDYAGMNWTGGDWGTKGWADTARADYAKYLRSDGGYDWYQKDARGKLNPLNKFLDKAQAFHTEQSKRRDEILRGFRDFTESGVGRALGATNRSVALRNQRQGLGRGGLAGRAAAAAETALRGQGDAAQQAAGIDLSKQMAAEQHQFMMSQSEFLNRLDLQKNQARLDMELARFQANLQRDAESRNMFYGVAQGIGQALPLLLAI